MVEPRNIADMQEAVRSLKKEQDVCILAHSYEAREIAEVADFTGDSFQLSVMASQAPQKTLLPCGEVPQQNVLMCGVRFMAETAKLLSPDKTVYLSNPMAGCPMAEQFSPDDVRRYKEAHPDVPVVAYVNTTAALKTVCDVCVTSSSAVQIVRSLPQKKILFIPDCHLGHYVQVMVPDKEIELFQGGCPIHGAVTADDVSRARAAHPEARLLVHPECSPAVVEAADFVGSTSAIMDYAKKSEDREFLIGTEISIAEHLQYDCPGKRFYPLTPRLICPDMKATTLADVYALLAGETDRAESEILLDADTLRLARRCIDEMIRLG